MPNCCSKCPRLIGQENVEATHWILQSCNHLLCSSCFTSYSFQVEKDCPVCRVIPHTVEHYFYEEEYDGEDSMHRKLCPRMKSTEIIHRKNHDYLILLKNGSIPITTCLDHVNEINEEQECNTLQIIFKHLNCVLISNEKKEYAKEYDFNGHGTFQDQLDVLVQKNKSSVLFKCLSSLALGDTNLLLGTDVDRKLNFDRKLFLAVENIRSSIDTRGSVFRRMMTELLCVLGEDETRHILSHFGVCYTNQTRRKINKTQLEKLIKEANDYLYENISRHSYIITSFDNIGYKNRKGSKNGDGQGYEQFTALKHTVIDAQQLREMKIYALDDDEFEPLSRTRKNWSELRTENNGVGMYEKLLMPNDNDINSFGEVVLKNIHTILEGIRDGVFPSEDGMKHYLIEKASGLKPRPKVWCCHVFRGRDSAIESGPNNSVVPPAPYKWIYDIPLRDDLAKKETVTKIMEYCLLAKEYALNNAKIDDPRFETVVPILEDARVGMTGDGSPIFAAHNIMRINPLYRDKFHASFGGFHTMMEIYKMKGTLFEHTNLRAYTSLYRLSTKSQDWVLKPSDPNQAEEEFIQISLAIYLSAARQLIRIKDEKLDVDTVFDSDFEDYTDTNVEHHDTTGILEDMMAEVNGGDYCSDEDSDYNYNSEDDNDEDSDYESEDYESEESDSEDYDSEESDSEDYDSEDYDSEDYDSEGDHESTVSSSNEQAPPECEDENLRISPSEIVTFMIKRAQRHPQAFMVLLDLRFHEIILVLLKSEANANAELYFTALKLALLLFANTNANKYVEMVCNVQIERECMSEAERAIHDKFVLFQKTPNGKNRFTDLLFEKDVGGTRKKTGKFYNSTTENTQAHTWANLGNFREKKSRCTNDKSAKKSRKNMIKFDSAFCEAYLYCESVNLWRGKPGLIPTKPYSKRVNDEGIDMNPEPLESMKELYGFGSKEKLFKDILSTVSRGNERIENYFDAFHVHGALNVTTRPVLLRNLGRVTVTSDKLKKELELVVILDVDKLEKETKIYTIDRIKQEIAVVNHILNEYNLPQVRKEKTDTRRKHFLQLLVTARQRLRRHDPLHWDAILRDSIEGRFQGCDENATDIIKEELNHSFFTFKNSAALDNIGSNAVHINRQTFEAAEKTEFDVDEELDELTNLLLTDLEFY